MDEFKEESEKVSKRLKESDWLVIISLWERGEVTLRELSENFGVTEQSISQGLKRRGVKRASKAHLTHKEIESKTREEKEKLIEEIFTFKKRFLKYGDLLMNMTMNYIAEAKKEGKKIATVKPEIDTLISATKVFKTIRNDMFHLYDLYNSETQSDENFDFNIGVYSEADIESLRESQELMDRLMKDEMDASDEVEDDN